MVLLVGERIDPADEQVVVADGVAAGDRAFERRDRTVEDRQTRRAGRPGGAAEVLAAGRDRRPGEAVRQRLLVLAEDAHREAPDRVDERGDEPAAVERDDDERRLEADRAQGVDRDPGRSAVGVERRDHADPGHEVTHDLAEQLGSDLHGPESRGSGGAGDRTRAGSPAVRWASRPGQSSASGRVIAAGSTQASNSAALR